MSAKSSSAITMTAVLIAGIFDVSSANAQGASTSSLDDQLRAQYKLAKIVPESNGYKVAEPGTMLVVQKDGIFGVPLGSNSVDRVIYAIQKDTDLHHYNSGASNWKFGVGHKVYLSKVNIDAKRENVLFTIVECDCSDPAKPAYYKSIVDFEFPTGYLAAAEVGQIEDVISQVLTIDNGTNDPQPPVRVGPSLPGCLSNDEIIKLVQAKLPDSIVIAKIKSSTCEFNTTTDALIKLKGAGASDPVLQALVEPPPPPNGEAAAPDPSPAPGTPSFSVRHRHSLWETGDSLTHYCSGTLSVSLDGTVAFDCAETDDPSGRCDHISILSGSLKEVRVASNGALHLASKAQGNFDFLGAPGTIKEAMTAIAPLTKATATASTGPISPPPTPSASDCGDYDSCMKKGAASLDRSEGGAEALTEFQKASQLDPSKGEPLAGKGYAYLQMGQYDNAAYMWDRALKLGSTLSISVCHAGMSCGNTGDFLLSMKEVSFTNKKGQKEFATAPSAITSEVGSPAVLLGKGQAVAYYFQLRISGKNYRFYYGPRFVECRSNFLCPEPGITQQKVFADYVHGALVRIAAGDLSSLPSKP